MADKPTLLVVDDDEDLRTQMRWALADDFEVLLAGDREAAIRAVRDSHPAVVTLDLGLPPHPGGVEEGFAALDEIQSLDTGAKVIVITGREDRAHALRAVEQGAYDYFVKPIDVDELEVVLHRALKLHTLEVENRELRRRAEPGGFEGMLGASARMQEVFAAIRKVATVDAPVLLTGDSGTGKELAARAIHRLSARSSGPFVPINCGAIPDTLLESELFGHEKGAFTGAHTQRRGRIESAQGGTLFLDEIGELTPALQVKLLRVLQDGKVERLGGRSPIAVDARIITATNADLEQLLAEGAFREDLYYRIGVVTIVLPPLSDREDDVVLIADSLLRGLASEMGKRLNGFSRDALAAMQAHAWPGNVRELENRIRSAAVVAEGGTVTLADLQLAARDVRLPSLREVRDAAERKHIELALALHDHNITRAAKALEVSRPTLHALVEKHGLARP
jgi:two-component system NtrC family response regulator